MRQLINTLELENTLGSTPKLQTVLSDNSRFQNITTLDESNSCQLNWIKISVDVREKCETICPMADGPPVQ